MGRISPVEGICSKSVRNAGTLSSAVFATTERTTKKLRIGRIGRDQADAERLFCID